MFNAQKIFCTNYTEFTFLIKSFLILMESTQTAHLIPKVVCSRVTRPDTKYIVLSTSLMTSVLFAKHIGPLRMKGIANVPPNMVRKC